MEWRSVKKSSKTKLEDKKEEDSVQDAPKDANGAEYGVTSKKSFRLGGT
jgi:hypothetical protein